MSTTKSQRRAYQAAYARTYKRLKKHGWSVYSCRHLAREFATVEVLTDEPNEKEEAAIRKRLAVLEAERLDTYWREADSVKNKSWSGAMFCAPCVQPELRAAALLKEGAQ